MTSDSRVQDPPLANATARRPFARGGMLVLAVSVFVVAFYAWTAAPSRSDWGNVDARGAYYNLLVDGLSAGQLNLKVEVPPGLAALTDPYDPVANLVYRTEHHVHDTSYYRGKLYIYYGITPALVLFGPYHWLTGGYLFNKQALFVFASVGYLASAFLLWSLWRRRIAEVSAPAIAACALALGLVNSIPALLRVPGICEVAIGCGYAFTMLACLFVWRALQEPRHGVRWLALASLCYGLAVGARPSMLLGGIVLLLPAAVAWRRPSERDAAGAGRLLAAAIIPMAIIGLGLAAYNQARFGSIFEFGQRYQLAGDRQDNARHFSAAYLWFNFRLYFLSFAPWKSVFPFVQDFIPPAAAPGHAAVESAQGIFSNTPFALCALGALLAWRRTVDRTLRWFVGGIALLFLTSALVLCLFYGTVLRYQAEFHPPLVLLACLGVLFLERGDGTPSEAAAGWRRGIVRAVWITLLVFSIAASVFASVRMYAGELTRQGVQRAQEGRKDDAIAKFEAALRIAADYAPAHNNLGVIYLDAGDARRAAEHFAAATAADPRALDALNGLGRALFSLGRMADAADAFRRAIAVEPRFAAAHVNLAIVLQNLGRPAEAVTQFEAAIALGYDTPEIRQALEQARAASNPRSSAP